MHKIIKRFNRNIVYLLFLTILLFNMGCQKELQNNNVGQLPDAAIPNKDPQVLKDFTQVNLVGDNQQYNPARVDPLLVNAWGITFSPTGIAWISSEATGVSDVYNSNTGAQVLAAVSIPSPTAATGGHPTGIVFNGTSDFNLPNGRPARFIFAGDDGVISGWNGGTAAVRAINNAPAAGYFGLALATNGANHFLYAANFNESRIDVFDKNWTMVNMPFMDPNLPASYSPFNIQAIDNMLFVMYAKVGPDGSEIHHPGFGLVDVYNPDGSFVKRLISNGQLNSPWGIAKAPSGFFGTGVSSSSIESTGDTYLVGNFGDGRINAFSKDGIFLGQLRAHGNPIVIDGLWGISFAPTTATSIDPNKLFFNAGPGDETHGLFGYIVK